MNDPSPRPDPALPAEYGPWEAPGEHTARELARLLGLLDTCGFPVAGVALGHGRDAASRRAATAFAEAWQRRGGYLSAVVDWPEDAASWLRQARRLTEPEPDAWVVAAPPLGWSRLSRRLRRSTGWEARRTFGFASLGDSRAVTLAGPGVLHGMRGATANGAVWRVERGWIVESGQD
ncbi:hypothetical protein ACQYWQ_02190 [Streptomyces sp. P6-2-1]|uniref:hypothetical protein n=1 Tax=Streptomyces sp. P6-2-1 TaxID=3422591 RepID=UPI003D35AA5F